MQIAELALQRDKYKHLSDQEWRWFLQQAEGRERTADKLPTFAAIEDWWYPVRLSCEQCSSELTARYKAEIVKTANPRIIHTASAGRSRLFRDKKSSNDRQFADLTGGYGVDTFFLSEHFAHTDYVEQNEELCRIAAHNFNIPRDKVQRTTGDITVHNCTAEDFLSLPLCGGVGGDFHLLFLDPARRDSHGGKVFKLADCTPNVIELLPTLLDHLAPDGRIMLKLSPMIDITRALKELQLPPNLPQREEIIWDVHIVAVKNEVKEVLLLSRYTDISKYRDPEPMITTIDLSKKEQVFTFTREEEKAAFCPPLEGELEGDCYLFEPNAAILKAGAYKLVAQRFGLQKADVNTHLYFSDRSVEHFPGRVWKLKESAPSLPKSEEPKQANVLCRNYPLTPDQLKKKLHLRDGGNDYVIGCRINGKPTVLWAERVETD